MEDSQENDLALQGLLQEDFDAVQYLNDNLKPLQLSSQNQNVGAKEGRTGQLQTCSAELQAQITKLNVYNVRSSTEHTSLTDEILRSGNRLAYEVEVLRSDVDSLYDLLSETLKDDIQHFTKQTTQAQNGQTLNEEDAKVTINGKYEDPEFMQQLRTLGHVKARLEEVIRVFGEALKWPIPPSDVSMATSLIAVSAPELGVPSTAEDDRARAAIRQIRDDISDLLNSEGGDWQGTKLQTRESEEYQKLALVWQGTAEEKARNRIVDGFARIVADRRKVLEAQTQHRRQQMNSNRSSALPSRSGSPNQTGGGGLFGGLRKLRDEIYLD